MIIAATENSGLLADFLRQFEVTEDNFFYFAITLLLLLFLFIFISRNISTRSKLRRLQRQTQKQQTHEKKHYTDLQAKIKQLTTENTGLSKTISTYENERHKFEAQAVENQNLQKQLNELQLQNEVQKEQLKNTKEKLTELEQTNQRLKNDTTQKEQKLKELTRRMEERLQPEAKKEIDEIEVNLLKIEKLRRLFQNDMISEEEFTEVKQRILKEKF